MLEMNKLPDGDIILPCGLSKRERMLLRNLRIAMRHMRFTGIPRGLSYNDKPFGEEAEYTIAHIEHLLGLTDPSHESEFRFSEIVKD